MIRPALTMCIALYITGCGGDSSSVQELLPESELGGSPQVDIDFVNTANKSVDYFVKQSGGTETLFDPNTQVASNSNSEVASHSVSWSTPTPVVLDIGAWDTNTQSETSESLEVMLNRADKLWAIAWLDNDELALSTIRQQPSSQEGKYSVRVFSHSDSRVQVISSVISAIEAKKGQITPYLTLENCSGELFFAAESISLCNLDPGKSYLLVTDGEDLLMAAEEK
ncbi:hypothetical protein BIT28_13870 [Photobacterium proteolyticum]|uniref:Lipoprotein n=1 Tax=Photobacterium proteolyticum TaxID=1903952 RepID=A0A1Q9GJ62_9GAMM|nr:hypothetical protein BIT28_13870 [Photobacterium proteolyticum]